MDAKRTVTVFCRVANGVELCLFRPGYDDGTGSGYHPVLHVGAPVVLKGPSARGAGANDGALHKFDGVPNEVDAEFWVAWAKQNALNPLFANGLIFAAPDGETP